MTQYKDTIACETLSKYIENYSLKLSCDVVKNGMIRIQTPFRYIDGSFVDIFVGIENMLGRIVISDMGETISTLFHAGIRPWQSKRKREQLNSICTSLNITNKNHEFKIELMDNEWHLISDAIMRLGQACIRIADMAFSQQYRSTNYFRDELEEVIEATGLDFESDVTITSRLDKEVILDFCIQGQDHEYLVQSISSKNPEVFKNLGSRAFIKWFDISNVKDDFNFITLFDSEHDGLDISDIQRLEFISSVYSFPAEQENFLSYVAA